MEALESTFPRFAREAGVGQADGENDLRFRVGAAVGDVTPEEDYDEALALVERVLIDIYIEAAEAGRRHMPHDVLDGVRNGLRYRKSEPNSDPAQEALMAAAGNDPEPPPRKAAFVAYEDLADQPPPSWLVDGAIPDSGVTVIYGSPKSGKSLFATDLAAAIASGKGTWCDGPRINGDPGPVVFFALEGRAATVARLNAWREAHGNVSLNRRLVFGDTAALVSEAGRAPPVTEVAAGIREAVGERPRLIVVDTWAHVMAAWGLDENATRDQNLAAKWFEALSEAIGAPVLILAHSGKEDRGIRGSNALEAAASAVLVAKKEGARFVLEARLMRMADVDWIMTAVGAPVLKAIAENEEREMPVTANDEALVRTAVVNASDELRRHGVGDQRLSEFLKTVAAMAGSRGPFAKQVASEAERIVRAAGLVNDGRVMVLPRDDMARMLATKGSWLE